MRNGFGFNTNLFETNVLNLAVVVGIVVKVVGDAFKNLLDQRRERILLTLQDVDKKANEAKVQLEEAQQKLQAARLSAQEIRTQVVGFAEAEDLLVKKQLKKDLQFLKEKSLQVIQLERQRTMQLISDQVANLALVAAENILLKTFCSGGVLRSKQKELNEVHVYETFIQLKKEF